MINLYSTTVDSSGCGILRTYLPINFLNTLYANDGKFKGFYTHLLLGDLRLLAGMDIIRLQKVISPQQVTYARQLKEFKSKGVIKAGLIYDIDDDYLSIPDYHYAHTKFNVQECENALKTIMSNMNVVTASTKYLLLKMQRLRENNLWGTNFWVIPNLIPKFLYQYENYIQPQNQKPRIVWAGSNIHFNPKHLGDLGIIYDLVKNTQNEFEWIFVTGNLPEHFNGMNVKLIPWVKNLYDYPRVLRSLRADIGIAPLIDNEFNRCKSEIKLLEYSASKMITMSSNVEPYKVHSSFYFSGDWKIDRDTIIEIFNNKILREEKINCQDKFLEKYWMEDNIVKVYGPLFNLS